MGKSLFGTIQPRRPTPKPKPVVLLPDLVLTMAPSLPATDGLELGPPRMMPEVARRRRRREINPAAETKTYPTVLVLLPRAGRPKAKATSVGNASLPRQAVPATPPPAAGRAAVRVTIGTAFGLPAGWLRRRSTADMNAFVRPRLVLMTMNHACSSNS